jgi:exodeoxyribonuclease-3
MRIFSWNINGIRASVAKGLEKWLEATRPDVLCLQETRADPSALSERLLHLAGYESYWTPLRKKGYAGVATYCLKPVATWCSELAAADFDDEGRVLVTNLGDVSLYNVYFPNGKASPERLAYKLAFYRAFLDRVDSSVQSGRCVVFCGDVNTAHNAIDLARPAANARVSGFLSDERAWLDRWEENGWVDSFRYLHPDTRDAYTWWDMKTGARARNVGWRLDYCYIHNRYLDRLQGAGIAADVTGSDHCPIWLDLAD